MQWWHRRCLLKGTHMRVLNTLLWSLSAPCTPTHVTAKYDCGTSITSVMWDIARRADNYMVYAVSNQGYKSNISTTDTACSLSDLTCAQTYNITVVAQLGVCWSQPSQPFTVTTGIEDEDGTTKSLILLFNLFKRLSICAFWEKMVGLYNILKR